MAARIPDGALVVLIGASGSGKSSFARRHFRAAEIIAADQCWGMVADNGTDPEGDLEPTGPAYEALRRIVDKRLAAGSLTVVDATHVWREDRTPLVALAREHHVLPVALVFDLPEALCQARNRARPERTFGQPCGPEVVRRQCQALRRGLRSLQSEGFRRVTVFSSVEEVDAAVVVREPLLSNKQSQTGPFDIIGDVHGCYDELIELLGALGYVIEGSREGVRVRHSEGRKLIFAGDLVDRGPRTPDVLRLVMGAVRDRAAFCVAGNHDHKLARKLRGKDVKINHGLAQSLEQLDPESAGFRAEVAEFLERLVSHYVLDGGRLVVAHAGLKEEMQGRSSGAVRAFCMYGQTTGETDAEGLPVRYNWAQDYRGRAAVVYGHTPVLAPQWLNNTLNIDTGCVFGGRLTALRYPERTLLSVPARQTYYEPARPLAAAPAGALISSQEPPALLPDGQQH